MFLISVPRSRPSRFSPRSLFDRGMALAVSRQKFLIHGPADSPVAALTFEGGPHPERTPAILKVLNYHGVPATFFISGEKAVDLPDLVGQIADESHVIGQCGYFPEISSSATNEELGEQLLMSEHWIRKFTGETPHLFRTHRENLSWTKLRNLWRRNQTVVQWNYDPRDSECQSPAELMSRFANSPIRCGDIIRLHDAAAYTAAVLPKIISTANRCGIKFGTPLQWLK